MSDELIDFPFYNSQPDDIFDGKEQAAITYDDLPYVPYNDSNNARNPDGTPYRGIGSLIPQTETEEEWVAMFFIELEQRYPDWCAVRTTPASAKFAADERVRRIYGDDAKIIWSEQVQGSWIGFYGNGFECFVLKAHTGAI